MTLENLVIPTSPPKTPFMNIVRSKFLYKTLEIILDETPPACNYNGHSKNKLDNRFYHLGPLNESKTLLYRFNACLEIQLPNKKRMSAKALLNGYKFDVKARVL